MKKIIIILTLIVLLIPTKAQASEITQSDYSNSYSLMVGENVKLKTSETGLVKWSSKDKKIAKVSKNGMVKAIKKGKTVITAKVNGKKIDFDISVSKGVKAYLVNISTSSGVSTDEPAYISKSKFDSLSNGHSYDDAVKIIGANGSLTSYTDDNVNKKQTEVYTWIGEDGASNAYVTFVNGKIVDKSEVSIDK